MKQTLVLFLFVLTSLCTRAQNCVSNPGFESYNNCPNNLPLPGGGYPGNIVYSPAFDSFPTVQSWVSPLKYGVSEYFNLCDTLPGDRGIPENQFGYQLAHSGNGYAGMYMYSFYPTNLEYDTYVETKLAQPLLAGHRYAASFYISPTSSKYFHAYIVAVDRIGLCITDTFLHYGIDITNNYLQVPATIESPPGVYFTDTSAWYKVSGIYDAHGGEQWVTIGHFRDAHPQQDTLLYTVTSGFTLYDSIRYCFMFVDDVCIWDITANTTDTNICTAAYPIELTGPEVPGNDLWSTGDTTAGISALHPGVYWRQVTNDCMYHTDTFRVATVPITNMPADTTICKGIQLTLNMPQEGVNYLWNTGDTSCCIAVTATGVYSVTASSTCGIATDTSHVTVEQFCSHCMLAPTAFTPNNDGTNDLFKVIALCPILQYHIRIFNRWGQQVFSSADNNEGWNGMYNGVLQDVGQYYYLIQYTANNGAEDKSELMKGSFTLIR